MIFLLAAVGAVFGAMSFRRIRWRGRAAHLAKERARKHESGHAAGASAMLSVLKTDQNYRNYMVAMFVLGLPNIAGFPLFVLALDDQFELNYTQSISLTQVLPVLVPVLVIPFWARMIDRMHIIRFRAFHAWVFVAANLLMGLGLLTHSLQTLFLARVVLGVAFGGGMLAWNLGHHDFAKRELATIYMGIHVTLTGVRGVIGPFIGLLLYRGLSIPTTESLTLPGLGAWTFIVLAGVNACGGMLFLRLHLQTRAMQRAQLTSAQDSHSPDGPKSV
ncbi:MAG: hypothetical protein IID54_01530 [Proteobacteria bacterium]|nr:hypothetical protein [Pseudomonadota bacterium]